MTEKNADYSPEPGTSGAERPSSPGAVRESASSPFAARDEAKKWPTSAAEFDEMFDNGEDIDHLIDWSRGERINAPKRVNVDFPAWMVRSLDAHAKKRGVTRQALIKMWLADRLEAASSVRAGWAEAAAEVAKHETEEEAEWRSFGNEGDRDLKW